MKKTTSIGGYFGLESKGGDYPFAGVSLNSGRNALRYIVRAYNIKEMYVPYYTCPVVWETLKQENVNLHFYMIDKNLKPILDAKKDSFVLVNDYFGVSSNNIRKLANKYHNLIVDDAQSIYAPKIGLAHFNSPRKFFGVPDGGFALLDKTLNENLPKSRSWQRCLHLLQRADEGAEVGYADFKKNDEALADAPFAMMSNLTHNLLSGVYYAEAKEKRLVNFSMLHKILGQKNQLKVNLTADDVPMVYPFLTDKKDLRKTLIDNKIFVATYWPQIESICPKESFELYLQKHLLPLPIDQRYGKKEMQRIWEIINAGAN